MYFYGSNLGPPGPGPSWTLDRSFDKLSKGLQAMLHTKFQASEPGGSEDFEIFPCPREDSFETLHTCCGHNEDVHVGFRCS